MRSAAEVRADLQQVLREDRERQTHALERLIAESDAVGDDELSGECRRHLLSAYTHSGAPSSAQFAPFAWLVQRFDDPPGWWQGREDRGVLWAYKWLIDAAINDSSVALPTLRALVDGMAERYERRGQGRAPVLEATYKVQAHVHDHDHAAVEFVTWIRAPRTSLSDCQACEPTTKVVYYAAVDCHSEALEEFWPVHRGGLTCLEQPETMYAVAVPSLLLTGHAEVAARAHLQGTRTTRGSAAGTSLDAEHIGHCARGGQLARGLELLEQRMRQVGSTSNDTEELRLTANGALLLSRLAAAGHDLEIVLPDGSPSDVAGAERVLRDRATQVAAAFDARNGTTAESDRLRRLLDADDLPTLELGAATPRLRSPRLRSPRAGRAPEAVVRRPAAPDLAAPDLAAVDTALDASDPVALGAAAEEALHAGRLNRVMTIARAWLVASPADAEAAGEAPAEAPEVAWAASELDLSAMRVLEAEDLSPADAELLGTRAAARLRAHGWEAEALLAEQALTIHRIDESLLDDPVQDAHRAEALAFVASIDAALTGAISPRVTAGRLGSKARSRIVRLTRDDEVRERCLREGLDLSSDVGPTSPADDRWGRAILMLAAADKAEPAAKRALARDLLTLLSDGLLPHLRVVAQLTLASAALDIEEHDDALTHADAAFDLALDLHETGGDDRAGLQCVFHAGGRLRQQLPEDRAARLAELLGRHLRFVQGIPDPDVAPAVRLHLADALRRSGRAIEAAECLELALTELGDLGDPARDHAYLDLPSLHLALLQAAAETSLSLGEAGRAGDLADRAVDAALAADQLHQAVHAAELATRVADQVDEGLPALAAYRRLVALADRTLAEGSFDAVQYALYGRREIGARTLTTDGRDAAERAFDRAETELTDLLRLLANEGEPRISGPDQRQWLLDMVAWERPRVRQSRAQMRLAAEAYADALTALTGLEQAFAELDAWRDAVIAISLGAHAHAGLGDLATASAAWERAVHEAGVHDLLPLQRSIANAWVWALDDAGDTQAAHAVWERWARES